MTSAIASVESIMDPRTDSSASRFWGGFRTPSDGGLLVSSATRAIRRNPPSREREGRPVLRSAEDDNAVENENGSSRRIFPCHFGIYLHVGLWRTMWTIVNTPSDKNGEGASKGALSSVESAQRLSGR